MPPRIVLITVLKFKIVKHVLLLSTGNDIFKTLEKSFWLFSLQAVIYFATEVRTTFFG